jgi:hypothetical protein
VTWTGEGESIIDGAPVKHSRIKSSAILTTARPSSLAMMTIQSSSPSPQMSFAS